MLTRAVAAAANIVEGSRCRTLERQAVGDMHCWAARSIAVPVPVQQTGWDHLKRRGQATHQSLLA